jgi:hypothetical protein
VSEYNHFKIVAETEEGEHELDCTPENTQLYMHSNKYRDVDHIFHILDSTERTIGAFVWRHALGEEAFNEQSMKMIDSGLWVYNYRPEPVETDIEQFTRDFLDIPNEIPDEW